MTPFYRDGKDWVAQALNVDVSSFGESVEAPRAALQEALELYFEDGEDGEDVAIHEARIAFERHVRW
ncbi:MAG: hypothetical protein ACR2NO_09685 [Chloroflexota bacterium]